MKITRRFEVGSEWLYYKIYCSERLIDFVLVDLIRPLVKQLLKREIIKTFFFVRYHDPEPHIRLRFNLKTNHETDQLINIVFKSLHKSFQRGIISKITIDVYQREIERYGLHTMVLSEQFFHTDSVNILNALSLIAKNNDENMRWIMASKLIDHYLDLFGLGINEKIAFTNTLQRDFRQEFTSDKQLTKGIAERYQNKKHLLFKGMHNDADLSKILHGKTQIYQKVIVKEILEKMTSNTHSPSIHNLISSLLHMSLNRLFEVEGRFSEFMIYYFLHKYYEDIFFNKTV